VSWPYFKLSDDQKSKKINPEKFDNALGERNGMRMGYHSEKASPSKHSKNAYIKSIQSMSN
jgi:hypothetical protein